MAMTMRDVIKAQATAQSPRADITSAATGAPVNPVCSNLWRNALKG